MNITKKAISVCLVITLFCLAAFAGVNFDTAYAKEAENRTEKAENGEESAFYDKLSEYIKSDLIPIISGLITAITAILAMLVPYVKTLGKLKTAQSAYACVFDENERLHSLASQASVSGISEKITAEVSENMETRLKKYEELLGELLKESEESAARLSALISGAKIAWKEADGVDVILSAAPTATALKRNALKVELLKSYVADYLGVKREEIDEKIDAELCDV